LYQRIKKAICKVFECLLLLYELRCICRAVVVVSVRGQEVKDTIVLRRNSVQESRGDLWRLKKQSGVLPTNTVKNIEIIINAPVNV
jgi:hypothetical protein